jgi:2-polyprenyl-3-methyl-5-hydroxy-6-metoxy-1,4-benzoquinol methylase
MSSYDYSIYYRRFHDESDAHAEAMASHMASVIAADLPDDRASAVLDVGCGFGFALRALTRLGFHDIQGIEQSPQQARACEKAGLPVKLCDDSIGWLEARPAAFDCALLLDVLEHVPRAAQIDLLRAIRTSLRPGGRLIVTTPNANAILASRWLYNDYTHHSSFTEHSLHFVLANAGFEPIRIDNSKGIGRFPLRLWRRSSWLAARKWIVRWCWLQVFKAELPWEKIDDISFELNLKAVAFKSA